MTAVSLGPPVGRPRALLREMRRVGPARVAVAVGVVVTYLVALLHEERLRGLETCLSVELITIAGQSDAACTDQTATFWLDGRYVGYTITIGCTAAMLLFPFFGVAALLSLVRRAPLRNTLLALAASVVMVFTVNQIRLVMIWAGMRTLGFERGYELTHILVGTVVSTIGLVAAALIALKLLLAGQPARAETG